MHQSSDNYFINGLRDGVPIALGYFAVAFSLGIAARNAGLTPLQGFICSILNHASAGEYAAFTAIAAGAAYLELALMILVANARYLLMSCALSQKIAPGASIFTRAFIGFGITDEIFGISVAFPGYLVPSYYYGAMAVSFPSWAGGTALGIVVGNILPPDVVTALSVAIYGMFLAIIIPPARKDRVVLAVVAAGFGLSFLASRLSFTAHISEGTRIILLTVLIAAAAAYFFPHEEALPAPAAEEADASAFPHEEELPASAAEEASPVNDSAAGSGQADREVRS